MLYHRQEVTDTVSAGNQVERRGRVETLLLIGQSALALKSTTTSKNPSIVNFMCMESPFCLPGLVDSISALSAATVSILSFYHRSVSYTCSFFSIPRWGADQLLRTADGFATTPRLSPTWLLRNRLIYYLYQITILHHALYLHPQHDP